MTNLIEFYTKLIVYDFEKGLGVPILKQNRHNYFDNEFIGVPKKELEEIIFSFPPIAEIVVSRPSDIWETPTINRLFANFALPERSSLYNFYRVAIDNQIIPILYKEGNQVIVDNVNMNLQKIDIEKEGENYTFIGIPPSHFYIYQPLKTLLTKSLELDMGKIVFLGEKKKLFRDENEVESAFDNVLISGWNPQK
ncbi:MAG: hypothetical protein KC550_07045 [Nanoarchaeota archaeon]|nr:hypothetical protein [Nanoarchaeota archaeon]